MICSTILQDRREGVKWYQDSYSGLERLSGALMANAGSRLTAHDRESCNRLILAMWPNTAKWMASPEEGGTEVLSELLDRIERAAREVGWESIDRVIREQAMTVKASTVPVQAIVAQVREVVQSERNLSRGGVERYAPKSKADPDAPIPLGEQLPWRRAGMRMPAWLAREGSAARAKLAAWMGSEKADAVMSLFTRGRIVASDVRNAHEVGTAIARTRAGKLHEQAGKDLGGVGAGAVDGPEWDSVARGGGDVCEEPGDGAAQ